MDLNDSVSQALACEGIGEEIFALTAEIYPICRSITGSGVRATLRQLSQHIGLELHEVPTGTQAFDWTVPREWNIRDAYIKDGNGRKIVDFASSNLHVMSYSTPVRAHVPLGELKKHLHSLPQQPDAIPYRTLPDDPGQRYLRPVYSTREAILFEVLDGEPPPASSAFARRPLLAIGCSMTSDAGRQGRAHGR